MKTLKPIISVILAVVVVFAAAVSVGALIKYVRGDADGDGTVTAIDCTVIQRNLVGVEMPSFNKRAADIDGKGLDIFDVTMIQRYLVEIETGYNIGKTVTFDEYELPIV